MAQGLKLHKIPYYVLFALQWHVTFSCRSWVNMLVAESHIVAAILLCYISMPWRSSQKNFKKLREKLSEHKMNFPEIVPDNLASTQGLREGMLWPKIHRESDLQKIAWGHKIVVSWPSQKFQNILLQVAWLKLLWKISNYHILCYSKIQKIINLMFPGYRTYSSTLMRFGTFNVFCF